MAKFANFYRNGNENKILQTFMTFQTQAVRCFIKIVYALCLDDTGVYMTNFNDLF